MDDVSISYSEPLGQAIRTAREKMGCTQRGLAKMLGIDFRTIIKIENGRGNPKMEVLFPLVRCLKVDARDIFNPERGREDPELCRLRTMVEDCSEEEAALMVPIFQDVFHAIRNSRQETVNDTV